MKTQAALWQASLIANDVGLRGIGSRIQLRSYIVTSLLIVVGAAPVKAQEGFPLAKSRSLLELADELRERGVYEQHLGTMVTFPAVEGYDELQDLCDVAVLATLLDSRSRPSGGGGTSIETVHRFHVDEIISGSLKARNTGDDPLPPLRHNRTGVPGAPNFRLPTTDEVLVWRSGGMLRINDVTFKQRPTYPPFKKGYQYILFLKRTLSEDDSGYYANQRFTMFFRCPDHTAASKSRKRPAAGSRV